MKARRRHPQYWIVRFTLAFAIVSLPAVLLWLDAMQGGTSGPMYADSPGLDPAFLWMAVVVGLWLAGVIWMIRIFRGPSIDPPPWRYRDR